MNPATPDPAALLFDMDGLTIDTEPYWLETELSVAAAHGYDWTEADQEMVYGGPISKAVEYLAQRIAQTQPAAAVSVAQLHDEIIEKMVHFVTTEPTPLLPGVATLLKQAHERHIPCALVSASYRVIMEPAVVDITKQLGYNPYTAVVAGDDIPRTKPHPDPYLKAAALLGVPISQALVFEDSPTGVQAGLASGAVVCAVPHLSVLQSHPRMWTVPSLAQQDWNTLNQRWRELSTRAVA